MRRQTLAKHCAVLIVAFTLAAWVRPAGGQRVRDSAGIAIVQYTARDAPKAKWRISDLPAAIIGGPNATEQAEFNLVSAVVQLGAGRIGVAVLDAGEIRIFDSTGTYLSTLGRRGRGPGEFPDIWQLWNVKDTLIGVDGSGISQIFDAAGRYVRTIPRTSTTTGRVQRIGYLSDGTAIGLTSDPTRNAPPGRSRQMATLYTIHAGEPAEIGRFPARIIVRHGQGRPSGLAYGPIFTGAVLSQLICVGFGEEYVVNCLDKTGKERLRITRNEWNARRVSDRDKELFFASVDSANPRPENAPYRAQVRANTEFAERFAAFGRFVASTDNELWIGPAVPDDGSVQLMPSPLTETVWSIYSPRGEWLSDVTLPTGFRLISVGDGKILGLLRTSDGAEQVVVYRVLKTHR